MIIRKARREDFEKFFSLEKEFAVDNRKVCKEKIFQYKIFKDDSKRDFFKRLRQRNRFFCFLEDGFDKAQKKSLGQVSKMVKENGATVFNNLNDVAEYLNNI